MSNPLNIETKLIDLECGMKMRYSRREGFQSSFVGIGVKYGSNDFNFTFEGKEYYTKTGIAHFIEHKCFTLPDGSDAFFKLSNLGVSANAYTSNDRTVYFFNTVDSIYEPLKVLLDMMFTKGFTKENVEHEKSIICNEINMYSSNLDYKLETITIQNLFLNTGAAYDIAGTLADVRATTLEEMEVSYDAFYHPSNLILVVISDLDEKELVSYVNKYIRKYDFKSEHKIESLSNISHLEVEENPVILKGDIEEEKFAIGIRLQELEGNMIEQTYFYDYIMYRLTSESSPIYQNLLKQELINPDIQYQCTMNKTMKYLLLVGSSKNAEKTVDVLLDLLNTLEESMFDEESFVMFKKNTLSETIRSFDSIYGMGELFLDYQLADLNYLDVFNVLNRFEVKDLSPYLTNVKKSLKSVTLLQKE